MVSWGGGWAGVLSDLSVVASDVSKWLIELWVLCGGCVESRVWPEW